MHGCSKTQTLRQHLELREGYAAARTATKYG